MRFDIYLHHDSERIDRIEDVLAQLLTIGTMIMAKLDELVERVADQSTQLDSLNTFVEGLQQQIRDLGINPQDQAKIDEIFKQLQANDQKIADAFTENTPAADNPGGTT